MKKYYKTKYRQNTFWYILAVFVFVTLLIWYIPSVKSDGQAVEPYFQRGFAVTEVYVNPNDKLWTLHSMYGGKSDIRKWVQAVEELNGRKSAMIYEGEKIKVWEDIEQ